MEAQAIRKRTPARAGTQLRRWGVPAAILSVALVIAGCTTADPALNPELANPVPISLANPGFEAADGWDGLVQEASEYWAPVEGRGYARVEAGEAPLR